MAVLQIADLPADALDAAARFHADELPRIRQALATKPDYLTLVFPPADFTHTGWRLSAVQALAREYAPIRVNALAGGGDAAIAAAVRYCEAAGAVTGQVLQLDGKGAGPVL